MNNLEKLEQVKQNLKIITSAIEDEKENTTLEDIDKLIKISVDIIEK